MGLKSDMAGFYYETVLLTRSFAFTYVMRLNRRTGAVPVDPSVSKTSLKLICRKRSAFMNFTNLRVEPEPEVFSTVWTEIVPVIGCPHVKFRSWPHVAP